MEYMEKEEKKSHKKRKKNKKHKRSSMDEVDDDIDVTELDQQMKDRNTRIEEGNEACIKEEEALESDKKKAKKDKKMRKTSKIFVHEREVEEDLNGSNDSNVEVEKKVSYAYEVDEDDHCESPEEAYQDIDHMLCHISILMQKSRATLRIYDPYHCKGSMIERLKKLGYEDVYNKNEDFYVSICEKKLPEYDVLVTNPPYSGDHMEKLLKYVLSIDKPSFLLIPNYVYMKDYYSRILSQYRHVPPPVFIVPNKRYLYTTPYGRRQAKSAKYTSPFPTFWFCFLGSKVRKNVIDMARKYTSSTCKFIANANQLPLEVCSDNDPRKKKMRNNEKRKKNKNRKKKQQEVG